MISSAAIDDDTKAKLDSAGFVVVDNAESATSGTKLIFQLTPNKSIVEHLREKLIFITPVKHEVFLSDLTDCSVACSAQQIRIRHCHRLKLFNYIAGSVFSEESSDIQLLPYPFHDPQDERFKLQQEKRHYATYQSLDNPFNPEITFSVSTADHFFDT